MEETVEAPRGSEHSFASAEDVIAKFYKLAGAKAGPIVEAVMGAEGLADAADLVRLLARPTVSPLPSTTAPA